MKLLNRGIVVIKPTQKFLDWVNQVEQDDEFGPMTLEELQKDCTTLLVPDVITEEALVYMLEPIKQEIFEMELADWYTDQSIWPKDRSPEIFDQWFIVEFHSMVWDLIDQPIVYDMDTEDEPEPQKPAELPGLDTILSDDMPISAEAPFRRGDAVAVRDGIKEPGHPHNDLSGWQGRVVNFLPGPGQIMLALVEWDSITLEQLSEKFILEHKKDGWNWGAMLLDIKCLKPVWPRDTRNRTERYQSKMDARWFWPFIPHRGERIANILQKMDIEDPKSVSEHWQSLLEANLSLPYEACLRKSGHVQGLEAGDFVTVLSLTSPSIENGLMTKVKFKNRHFIVPLSHLTVLKETSSNFRWVEDYRSWFEHAAPMF